MKMNNSINNKNEKNNNPNLKNLLDKAHDQGFEVLDTILITTPTKEFPIAVVKKVIKINGKEYSALGEASTHNVDELVKESLVSMADTRALCRALRIATNTPETSYEEMKHRNNPESESSSLENETKWTEKQENAFDYYIKKKEITGELLGKVNELQDKRKKQGYLSQDDVSLIIGQLKWCPNNNTNKE